MKNALFVIVAVLSSQLAFTPSFSMSNIGYRGLSYEERSTVDIILFDGLRVNTFNGNLVLKRQLLFIPGRGLPVELYLTYNSDHRLISSPFGKGWKLSYDIRYVEDSAGNVTIVWGDGRQDVFIKTDTGYTAPTGVYMSLSKDSSGVFILKTKEGISFMFENPTHRKLTQIKDPNGNSISLNYDELYRLVSITDAAGREYKLTYNNEGKVARVEDSNLPTPRYYDLSYDSQGNLIEIKDPLGNTEKFSYSSENRLVTITDKKNNTIDVSYNSDSVVASISKGERSNIFAYDKGTKTTTFTDPRGNSWKLKYGSPIKEIKDPIGNSAYFQWDNKNNLSSFTDRLGNTTSFEYDNNGNITKITDPLGRSINLSYEQNFSRLTSFTDKKGNSWSFEYDNNGNLKKITDPYGNSATFNIDSYGQVTSFTDRTGRKIDFTYDSYGNIEEIINPLGGTTKISYDGAGRPVKVEDPNGNSTEISYDLLDRVLSVTDGAGNSDQRTYDSKGNLLSYSDREGATWNFSYNQWDELVQVVGPPIPNPNDPSKTVNPTVILTRDKAGNVVELTDPRGKKWQSTYDALGRRTEFKDPLGNTWIYRYDKEGRLVEVTDAEGQKTTYTRDELGRIVRMDFADGSSATFTYDENGNLTTAKDQNSDYSMSYNKLNRLSSFTDNKINKTVSYGYDEEGRLTSKTYPDGEQVTFAYNQAGWRSSMTTPNGTTNYTHDNGGRITGISYPSGISTEIVYDKRNLVEKITHKRGDIIYEAYTYERDKEGRIVHSELKDQKLIVDYEYNPYGWIIQEVVTDNFINPPETRVFKQTYDPAGNVVSYERFGNTGTVTWDDAGRAVQDSGWAGTPGGATFEVNYNGSRVRTKSGNSPAFDFTYDSRQRLTQVQTAWGDTYTYTYDVFGRLIGIQSPYGGNMRFFYGDPFSSLPVVIYDSTGNTPLAKFYKNSSHVRVVESNGIKWKEITLPTGGVKIEFIEINPRRRSSQEHREEIKPKKYYGPIVYSILTLPDGRTIIPEVQGNPFADYDDPFSVTPNFIDPLTGEPLPVSLTAFPDTPESPTRKKGWVMIRPPGSFVTDIPEVVIPKENPDNTTGEDVPIQPHVGDVSGLEPGMFTDKQGFRVGDVNRHKTIEGESIYWTGGEFPPFSYIWLDWLLDPDKGCYIPMEPSYGSICRGGRVKDRWNRSEYTPPLAIPVSSEPPLPEPPIFPPSSYELDHPRLGGIDTIPEGPCPKCPEPFDPRRWMR